MGSEEKHQQKRIAALVVTYNRKDSLEACVGHLLAQEGAKCDVVIIDNGSTDGTQLLASKYADQPRVVFLETGENLGGAGGFCLGMEACVSLGYDWVWAMDDDAYADSDALAKLIEADRLLEGNWGFLSSHAYWRDGSPCTMNRQYTSFRGKVDSKSGEALPVIMATFVGFLVSVQTIRRFGLPIAEFFIWADDLEYSRRISRELPCYAIPGSRILHGIHSNEKVGIENDSEDRLWRYRLLYRNELYVMRREGLQGIAYELTRVGLHTARVFQSSSDIETRLNRVGIIWKSFFAGMHFEPQITRLTETNQRI